MTDGTRDDEPVLEDNYNARFNRSKFLEACGVGT